MTFRVPLVISVPGVLDDRSSLPYVSSHIDIAPSIQDLLGWTECRWAEQGTLLWAPELAERTTLFLGRSYLGADGYFSQNRIFMVKHFIDATNDVAWDGVLSFSPGDLTDRMTNYDGKALIDAATRLQVNLAKGFVTGVFQNNVSAD